MKDQEKLYAAIGGASPELIVRSEKRRRSWQKYCMAAAACLTLALIMRCVLPSWTGPAASPPDSPPLSTLPDPPEDPDSGQLLLPEHGSEIGKLRLLSYAPKSQEAVDFLIYINEEQFSICEENGLYSIRSRTSLPDNFPKCGLDILYLPGSSPEQAREDAAEALKDRYADVLSEEETAILTGSLYLRASAGTDWNSEQAELWFVDDGQGGTFALTAQYFLEAEEGMGQWFHDMVSSFRVVALNETVPDWMRGLYETVDQLCPALFANNLSGVSGLLAENADVDAYGQDVWEYLTIASVDYTPDNDRDPSSATVSVKHRLNLEEGDSFSYLTMHLAYQEGQWRLCWSGIEK